MTEPTRGWRERAREHFASGEFRAAHAAALEGLAEDADDLDALRLAGRAGVEIGTDEAVEQLRRVSELAPDDAKAWRHLGDALAAEGRLPEAEQAWTRALELRPGDSTVLTALGHAALAAGRSERCRCAPAERRRGRRAQLQRVAEPRRPLPRREPTGRGAGGGPRRVGGRARRRPGRARRGRAERRHRQDGRGGGGLRAAARARRRGARGLPALRAARDRRCAEGIGSAGPSAPPPSPAWTARRARSGC